MAEVQDAPAGTENKVAGNIVSAGKPQSGVFPGAAQIADPAAPTGNEPPAAVASDTETPEAKAAREAAAVQNNQPHLTDDQLKEILKGKGITFDDFDSLKKKVEYTPPAPALSEEEQKRIETETENKLYQLHVKRGGTPDQWAAFKGLIAADAKELGINKVKADLIKDGFTAEQAEKIATKMHFQLTDDELALIADEDEKALLQKARDFGLKKQENRGLYTKNTAKSYFDSLKTELQELDTENKKMEQHTAKAVDAIKNFQRKQTLQLGEREGVQLSPVEYDVQEETLNEVLEMVKDPVKFEQLLYTKEGDLNLDFLVPHLVNSVTREKAAKVAFFTGETNAINEFQAKFGSTPPPIGGNGKQEGQKGKIVAAGKPQAGKPAFYQK